jgi:hypothetical protein
VVEVVRRAVALRDVAVRNAVATCTGKACILVGAAARTACEIDQIVHRDGFGEGMMMRSLSRVARSGTVRYILVALLTCLFASPVQTLATDGGLPALEQRIAAAEATIASLQTAVTDTLTQAKQYTDQQIAAVLAAAKAYTDAQVGAEATARQAGDTTLQTNINSETAARGAADSTLQGNINAEATARTSGDASTLAAAKAYTDSKGVGTLSGTIVVGNAVLLCGLLDPTCDSTAWGHASCPAGSVATGGGFESFGHTAFHAQVSRPEPFTSGGAPATGWAVYADNTALAVGIDFKVWVVCAKVNP